MARDTVASYPVRWPIATRWADNDHYGHVNNVTYYAYFDTAVNAWLMSATGVVAETSCTFLGSVSFPDDLQVGIRIARLGSSSITYTLAIFRAGEAAPVAEGRFVHVYVDRDNGKPVPIPAEIRAAALQLG